MLTRRGMLVCREYPGPPLTLAGHWRPCRQCRGAPSPERPRFSRERSLTYDTNWCPVLYLGGRAYCSFVVVVVVSRSPRGMDMSVPAPAQPVAGRRDIARWQSQSGPPWLASLCWLSYFSFSWSNGCSGVRVGTADGEEASTKGFPLAQPVWAPWCAQPQS